MDFYTWRERRKQGLPGFESSGTRTNNVSTSASSRVDKDKNGSAASQSSTTSSSSRIDPQEWANSSAAIINEIGEYYKGYRQSNAAVDSDIADRALDLLSKASSVRNQYARGSDARKSIDELVSSLSQAYDWATRKMSEYSQYDTEAQYRYRDNQDFYNRYGQYLEADDFEEYASRGAAVKNPTFDEVDGGLSIGPWKPFAEDVGNIVTYSRDNYGKIALEGPNATGKVEYSRMTDDEVNIYNYLLAKDGKETADKFLSEIEESLNSRMGAFLAENIEDSQPFLKNLAYITSSIGSGIEQARSGYRQLVSNEKIATPTSTYTSQYLSDNLGTVGKTLYQTGSTIGNMLPSIAVSMLTGSPAIGAATLGLSASGNAYGEALLDGYEPGQARMYSVLIGASEAALQYALGGISKLSGAANITSKIATKAAQIDNALLRVAAKYGVSIGGEIVEEELQNFLEPAFQSILFGVDYDAPTIDELIETAVVTALSTGILETGGIIGGDRATSKFNDNQYKDSARDIVNEAIEINPDNVYAQNLKKRVDSGKSVSGNQLAKLIQQNEEAIVKNDRDTIENSAKKRLVELGENSADIDTIANAITKDVFGEKLNTQEKYAVESSLYGNRVRGELDPANIRSGNYTTNWAENLNTNRINVDEYSAALNRAAEYSDIPSTVDMNINDAAVLYPRVDRSTADTVNDKTAENGTVNTENSTGSATSLTETKPAEPETKASSEQVISKQDTSELQVPSKSDTSIPNTPTNETVEPQDINVPDENRTARTLTDAAGQEYNTSPESTAEVEPEQSSQSLESLSKKYGKQAGAMVHTYIDGQDVVKYDRAYQAAYDMGKSGVSRGYAMQSDSASYLNESQRQLAYEAGQAAAGSIARERQSSIERRANGKTGWRRGTVRGEGVTLDELKSQFNDTQNQAYKVLSAISEATGIDIALYKSEADESGNFTGAQGYYKRSDAGTIYLDINAGLTNVKDVGDLSKYTILRTFSHEFTHYIENWSPVRYNELRAAVFSHMTDSGEDVGELIERQQALMSEDGRDVSYDRASREVVAEAMVDILPDSKFIDTLAEKHKSVFDKLLEKLKEFVSNIKAYFGRLYQSSSPEARAMKRQLGETLRYAESIVDKFDAAAVSAAENYQRTVATDEVAETTAETATADMKLQKELAEKPFEGQAELDKKRARYKEVMDILNSREEQSLDTLDEDTDTQEQQRYNLSEHSETDYTEEDNEWIQYQNRVTDEKLLTFLNDQQHEKVYRAMQVIDGKLYPPMAAKVVNEAGVNQLVEPSEIGVWEQAVERPDLIRNGNKFKLDKANGSSIEAAYNPYFHTSRSPLNDQFSSAYKRDNLVIVEGEIPSSELTSGYKAQYAKDSVGEMKWHSGPVSSKLKGDKARRVILSRWFRPLRIIPDAEIAKVIAKMLEGENISIPYKVITPSLRTALESEGVDIQYQRREGTLSDREVLERAASQIDSSKCTAEERAALELFQKRAGILGELEAERAKLGTQYKEQQLGTNVDRAAAAETLQQMHALDEQIKTASEDILNMEQRSVLKNILVEARGIVEAQEREHGRELIRRYRDRRNEAADIKKYRSRLMTDIGDLMDSLIKPDVKSVSGHIPEMLKNPIIDFIKSIDFSSKRQLKGGDATNADLAFTNKLSKLRGAIVEAKSLYGAYSGTLDLPEDFMPKLQALGDAVTALTGTASEKGYVINRMSAADLKSLSEIIRTLKKSISRFNTFHQNSFFKHVSDAAESSIKYLDDLPLDKTANKATNFMFWQTMRPAYAFERFGEGGKSIYDELRRGQARLAFHVKEIESFTKQTYTDNEVKGWERDVKSIELSDGSTMNLTVAQIMGLYKMYAQEDSRRHMLVGGIRVPKFAIRAKGKFRKDTHVDKGHMVSEADIEKIIGTLTPRQKEVADKLQRYMATQGAEWGNYVSMARFGERLFTNEQYYPINVDQRQLLNSDGTEKPPEGASLYALLNMNFTKQRVENASNGLMVYSIFDVFANHMSDMAQYNAMALPVLDALKWLNYRKFDTDNSGHILYYNDDGRTAYIGDDGRYYWSDNKTAVSGKERAGLKRKPIGSVRTSLTKAYGTEVVEKSTDEGTGYAVRFITNILKAYNNTESLSNPYDQIGMKSLARFNRSAIAYNLRVALQQPIAYLRAAMQLGADNMARGILHPIRNKEEMLKYSGIAIWKDLGFYDINISRGLNTLIKHDEGKLAQVNDFGMGLAELMDRTTWAAIWGASRDYVTRTTGLNEGDRGFIEKVIRRFEDTIYKTQVVDSVLTRSEIMRNKGFFVRAATSFLSEPMTEIAMISDAAFNFTLDVRRSDIGTAVKKNAPHIARVVAVYALTNVVNSLVTALLDAERDDDDYQEWYEKIGEAFKDNLKDSLNPFSKIPFITEFSELIKSTMNMFGADTYGNEPPQLYMQWSDSYLDAVKTFADKIMGRETNYQWYQSIYKMLQAVSGITGIAAAPLVREVVSFWNATIGAGNPDLKVRTYYPGDAANIKYAYLDGFLTAEEAIDELIRTGVSEDEDEAYFKVKEWDSGEASWSRFSELYGAVLEGKDYNEAARELNEHGYSEREIRESVQSQIGKWYREKDISKAKAEVLLKKHTELDEDEIDKFITEWSAKRETGISYDDIKESYLDGEISRERAVEMRAKYGGKSEEEAEDDVMAWDFERENPEVGSVSATTVKKYKELCEPIGISVEEWNAVCEFYSEAESDVDRKGKTIPYSKRDKVVEYIDSLPLTRRQKDALWLAMDYSEKTLDEAPWR